MNLERERWWDKDLRGSGIYFIKYVYVCYIYIIYYLFYIL